MLKLAPTTLHLCITDFCQLKCKHCYFGEYERKREMTLDEVNSVVDKFFILKQKFADIGYKEDDTCINISGGEPMMHTNINKVIRLFSNFDRVKFLSNGIKYSKEFCKTLINFNKNTRYQISLDGLKDNHDFIRGEGTFDIIVDNIKRLKDDFPDLFLQISFNSNNINYKDIIPLTKFVKTLGVNKIFFDRYVPFNKLSPLRNVSYDEYKKVTTYINKAYKLYNDKSFMVYRNRSMQHDLTYFCNAATHNQICVPNGTRYICTRYQIESGNWFTDNINTLFNNSIYWENKVLQTPEECMDCKHKKICNGGMRCLTYMTTGNMNKKDIHCYRYERNC